MQQVASSPIPGTDYKKGRNHLTLESHGGLTTCNISADVVHAHDVRAEQHGGRDGGCGATRVDRRHVAGVRP